jgi:hypothetical protein
MEPEDPMIPDSRKMYRVQTLRRWRRYVEMYPRRYKIEMRIGYGGMFYIWLMEYVFSRSHIPFPDFMIEQRSDGVWDWTMVERLQPWNFSEEK